MRPANKTKTQMKSVTIESLGFKLPCLFYESLDEADKAAGRTGAALDECNKNLQYRGANNDARDLIVAVVVEKTGIKQLTKTETKDGKSVEVIDENDGKFISRVLATANLPVSKEELQAEIESRAANGWKDSEGNEYPPIQVDIKARERKAPTPPKLSAEIKQAAAGFLSSLDDSKINAALAQFTPGVSFTRTDNNDANIETLGKLLRDWVKAKEKAAVAGFGQ